MATLGGQILSIYALSDCSQNIRYVGQTNNPEKRLRDHISEARTNKRFNRKNNWIRSMLEKDEIPNLIILETLSDKTKVDDAEIFHISQMKDLGFDLTNATDGGSIPPYPTKETLEKIKSTNSTRIVSEETRQRMSKAKKDKMTPEEILRLRSISNGTPPHFKGEDVSNSKLTNQSVVDIRIKMKSGLSIKEVLKDYPNVAESTIQNAATGKSWAHVAESPYVPRKKDKLTQKDKDDIIKLARNKTQSQIALLYNIHPSHVSRILNNKTKRSHSVGIK